MKTVVESREKFCPHCMRISVRIRRVPVLKSPRGTAVMISCMECLRPISIEIEKRKEHELGRSEA